MDHFHILDAYRSNKKLVPIDAELLKDLAEDPQTEYKNVFKAAYQTKQKHEALKNREGVQKLSLISVEIMIAVIALLFLISIASSEYGKLMKMTYSIIIISVFVICGVQLYLILFSKRMFNTSKHLKTIEEIYGLESDSKTAKAFNIATKIRNLELECQENDDIICPQDSTNSKIKKDICDLKSSIHTDAVEGSNEPDPGYLKAAIKHGMLYTMTGDAGQTIDAMVQKLRTILGSETYRVVEETDVYDIVDDVIVPKMIAANAKIVQRKKDAKGAVDSVVAEGSNDGDQCDTWCVDTVEQLVKDALDPKKSIPSNLLDQAWERCRTDMENVCTSSRLKTGEQQCAFGCAKVEEKELLFNTIRLDNQKPDENWVEPELEVDQSTTDEDVTADPGVGLERRCMETAMNDQDVDAAYFGQSEANGSNKCYFHYTAGSNAGGKGTFVKSTSDAFTGKLLYKEHHNVEVPGASPAEIANQIANEVRAIQSSFDLSQYDTHIYDTLRYQDTNFNANKAFYEGVFDNLVEMLKPQLDEDDDMLVPSIQRINDSLTEMTGRSFRKNVIWPVARSSGFLHIRSVRLDQKESYMPSSIEENIRKRFRHKMINAVLAVVASIFSYFSFTAERQAAEEPGGKLTLKTLIFDLWHRHIVALSVIMMFWAIVFSWMIRANARQVFNEYTKEENTKKFIQDVYDLRTFLFSLTDTMASLANDDNTTTFKKERLPLMEAVHTNKIDVINQFSNPDELIINTLTLENKLEFVKLCQSVVKSYDRCNKLDSGSAVPFPIPEIIVYVSSLIILIFGMMYTYSRFNITEVAQRVERIRQLRPKIYMGDASAAREVGGLLECAENSVEDRINLMKNTFVGMIGVTGIMITVLLVNSNDDYIASLNSGFMLSRGRCVT